MDQPLKKNIEEFSPNIMDIGNDDDDDDYDDYDDYFHGLKEPGIELDEYYKKLIEYKSGKSDWYIHEYKESYLGIKDDNGRLINIKTIDDDDDAQENLLGKKN